MTERKKVYNLHQLLDEIRASEGLPENLSTEAQLWDEILKREAFNMPQQFFPLIKEIHGKEYPAGTSIKPLATEFSVERSDTKEIAAIRADITIIVGDRDIYHFECQLQNDGTMFMRMFEYDVHIALSYQHLPTADLSKNILKNQNPDVSMVLRFPHSAVLYLQDNGNTPDYLTCRIQFQDGGFYDYKVPVLKVQSYSLEEIQEKHLSVLIPFLPLRFRKKYDPKANSYKLKKEELTSFYRQLILILDEEVKGGFLSETNRNTILNLLSKSLIRVFYKDESLFKEVITMTAPILELEIDKYVKALEAKTAEVERWRSQAEDIQAQLDKSNRHSEDMRLQLDASNKRIIDLQKQLAALQTKNL